MALALVLAGTTSALALNPERALTQAIRETWTSENGLPQNTVNRILQTRDGFLWVGTESGLVRFDGIEFRVFNRLNSPALRSDDIQALYEDQHGALWVGSSGGVCRYADGRLASPPAARQLAGKAIISFFEDSSGTLWAAGGREVYRFGPAAVEAYALPFRSRMSDAQAEQDGNFFFESDSGTLYLGTKEGLFRLAGQRFQPVDGFAGTPIRAAYRSRTTAQWMVTDLGWFQVKPNGFEPSPRFQVDGLSPSSFIKAVVEDRDGGLWIGTARDGIRRLHQGRTDRFTVQEGLGDNAIRCLFEDREGSLWIGTLGGGLIRMKEGKFSVLGRPEGLPDDMAWCALEDREGNIWIGSKGGLTRYRGLGPETFGLSRGLTNQSVLCLGEDRAGGLWIGTQGGGLNRMKQGAITPVVCPGLSSGEKILCLCPSRDGAVWIGTYGSGLKRLRDGRVESFTTRDGLSSDIVLSVAETADGTLWIATSDGLDQLVGRRVVPHGEASWQKDLRCLFVDRQGTLWAGTTQNGLLRIRQGRSERYGAAQGLSEEPITAVIDNAAGDALWVATYNGIYTFKLKHVEDFDAGRLPCIPCRAFGRADGLRNREFNGLGQPAACRDHLGRLWFPSVAGAVMVDERFLKRNPLPPPVTIETVRVDGNTRLALGSPEFPPGVGALEFHYTALSLLWPDQVKFKVRLEGYDTGWIDVGTRRNAYYTNLPPGRYTFRVVACNNDGVWNEAGASFTFYMQPKFHQTLLFKALVVLGLLLGVWGAMHWRVRNLQAHKAELEQRVEERTGQLAEANRKLQEMDRMKTDFLNMTAHELRTPLTSVVGFAKIVRKKQEELLGRLPGDGEPHQARSLSQVRGNMEIIVSEGERLTHLINDLLDIAKLEAGKVEWRQERLDMSRLVDHALQSTRSLFEQQVLAAEEKIEPGLPAVSGDRDRLIQVLINLLSNAVKFTPSGGTVTVEARLSDQATGKSEERSVTVSVRDQGVGIAPENLPIVFEKFTQFGPASAGVQKGTGLGLTICRQIVEHHGGRIWVESEPGRGSVFSFSLPAEID